MVERHAREKPTTPEQLEMEAYMNFQAAMDREDSIMREVDEILKTSTNRLEAERYLAKHLLPLIDDARRETAKAYDLWNKAMDRRLEQNDKTPN